ncbi:MAG TPA: hypothetical protein VKA84_15305 [Gemmatimonadaceae bacterium]|nr:hypothetical protein [Gemmatimonadaceae bacterium]
MRLRPPFRALALITSLAAAVGCDGAPARTAAQAAADSATVADAAAAAQDAARAVAAARTTDSIAHLIATVRPQRVPRPIAHSGLSPLADSIATALVFAPRTETWFAAAARGKRMLVDIGRVDAEVRKDPARKQAYKEAVARLSRIRVGARLRLHGPWGAEDVTVAGFDTWNGRIVATLQLSPRVDSLARTVEPLPAAAQLLAPDSAAYVALLLRRAAADDSAAYAAIGARDSEPAAAASRALAPAAAPAPRCVRDGAVSPALAARAVMVHDSLEAELRLTAMPKTPGLLSTVVVKHSQTAGCFGAGRLLLVVSLRAGDVEYVRERFVLLDTAGALRPLDVKDLRYHRFKAHEAIATFDADGDGTDDVAVRGLGERLGGTAILRLVDGTKLVRLTSGFAWENR